MPTLVYSGALEQAQDFVQKLFVENVRDVKWVRFEGMSHCIHYEDSEGCMRLIKDFVSESST